MLVRRPREPVLFRAQASRRRLSCDRPAPTTGSPPGWSRRPRCHLTYPSCTISVFGTYFWHIRCHTRKVIAHLALQFLAFLFIQNCKNARSCHRGVGVTRRHLPMEPGNLGSSPSHLMSDALNSDVMNINSPAVYIMILVRVRLSFWAKILMSSLVSSAFKADRIASIVTICNNLEILVSFENILKNTCLRTLSSFPPLLIRGEREELVSTRVGSAWDCTDLRGQRPQTTWCYLVGGRPVRVCHCDIEYTQRSVSRRVPASPEEYIFYL